MTGTRFAKDVSRINPIGFIGKHGRIRHQSQRVRAANSERNCCGTSFSLSTGNSCSWNELVAACAAVSLTLAGCTDLGQHAKPMQTRKKSPQDLELTLRRNFQQRSRHIRSVQVVLRRVKIIMYTIGTSTISSLAANAALSPQRPPAKLPRREFFWQAFSLVRDRLAVVLGINGSRRRR